MLKVVKWKDHIACFGVLMNACKILIRKLVETKQCGSFERGRMLKIDVHLHLHVTLFPPHRNHTPMSSTKPNKIRQ